jgi:hypothetical protein
VKIIKEISLFLWVLFEMLWAIVYHLVVAVGIYMLALILIAYFVSILRGVL